MAYWAIGITQLNKKEKVTQQFQHNMTSVKADNISLQIPPNIDAAKTLWLYNAPLDKKIKFSEKTFDFPSNDFPSWSLMKDC